MNQYDSFNREQLLVRIKELESLVEEYQRENIEEEKLNYAWTGNLGRWYWNFQTNVVTFNPLKVTTLGYDVKDIPERPNYQYFTEKIHPEDYESAMTAMREHLNGTKSVYETEYRIKTKDGKWRWYYDLGKITKRDEEGKPLLVAGIVFDITERKELQNKLEEQNELLEKLATTDELTKLFNRRTVYSKLEYEVDRAKRYKSPLSVMMIDIDHFKQVNDRYGHVRGDDVLREVADTIRRSVRRTDIPGRYGGEEFLVIFPNSNLAESLVVAERIWEGVNEIKYNDDLRVTISCGVKTYEGETIAELLQKADEKLYEAKEQGRNRVSS